MKKYILTGIILAAVLIRVGFILYVVPDAGDIVSDNGVYMEISKNLAETGVYGRLKGIPDAEDPPLFPMSMAPFYLLLKHDSAVMAGVRIFNIVLAIGVIYIIFLLGEKTIGNGLLPAFLTAIHPGYAGYVGYMLTESLYTIFITFAILCLFLFFTRENIKYSLLAGVSLGVVHLTREVMVLFSPLICLVFLFNSSKQMKGRLILLLFFILGHILAIGPWFLRNIISLKEPIIITSGTPAVIYASQHIDEDGYWSPDGLRINAIVASVKDLNKKEILLKTGKEIFYNITKRPGAYVSMIYKRFFELWIHPSGLYQINNRIVKLIYLFFHLFIIVPCLYSVFKYIFFKNKQVLFIPFFWSVIYLNIFFLFIIFPLARYLIPFIPIITILASKWWLDIAKSVTAGLYTTNRRHI